MEKSRRKKVFLIVALVVMVVGMSVGFAAFSNVLTISSSAEVKPNEEDFKLVIYGLSKEVGVTDNFFDSSLYSSTTFSVGSSVGSSKAVGSNVSINNSNFTLSNLHVEMFSPGAEFIYFFAVKNEGAYDAYLDLTNYRKYSNGDGKSCVASGEAAASLVEAACNDIYFTFSIWDGSGTIIEPDTQSYLISKGSLIYLVVDISYIGSSQNLADGDFLVEFEDIVLEFSTVDPSA